MSWTCPHGGGGGGLRRRREARGGGGRQEGRGGGERAELLSSIYKPCFHPLLTSPWQPISTTFLSSHVTFLNALSTTRGIRGLGADVCRLFLQQVDCRHREITGEEEGEGGVGMREVSIEENHSPFISWSLFLYHLFPASTSSHPHGQKKVDW